MEAASPSFDARRDARRRVYEYRLWNHPWRSVFNDRYSWHVRRPLRVDAMREALAALVGEHDFSCFRAAGCGAATAVRRIYHNELFLWEDHWVYRVEATGYLRHMVRNIVGTLVQIGLGERDAGGLPALIDSRDRTQAGPTAPRTGPVSGGGVLRIGIRGESVRRMASLRLRFAKRSRRTLELAQAAGYDFPQGET